MVFVLAGTGSFLIWRVQQDSRKVQGKEPGEFIQNEFDPAAVVTVQPFMPPVIELVNERQSLDDSRRDYNLLTDEVAENTREKLSREDADSGVRTASASTLDPEISEPAEAYEQEVLTTLVHAEKKADALAQRVLRVGRKMSLEDGEIVQGGCWDYVNTVYNRAGCAGDRRRIVFHGGGETEQYAGQELIRSGDWLFYIDHDYREARHSGIFIDWIDYERRIGLMLSYGGEERGEPAQYKAYDLSHVYNIIRPAED